MTKCACRLVGFSIGCEPQAVSPSAIITAIKTPRKYFPLKIALTSLYEINITILDAEATCFGFTADGNIDNRTMDGRPCVSAVEDAIVTFNANLGTERNHSRVNCNRIPRCAGCGETPYAKLITQLFGDRMYIANATGCSSIWGNSSPSTPYTVNEKGQGPAWSNSLFEDNAEFGYGMLLAQKAIRGGLKAKVEDVMNSEKAPEEVKAACKEYLDTFDCGATNGTATEKLVEAIKDADCDVCRDIVKNKDFLAKKSQWIFGGDGWAYDIGFGGVDHVLASGKDINVMVFDTEVYSNTGGQSSKATPTGAVAQFAAGGKETKKKDMASIAMSYGYVYVAQIAMGADYNQAVKAIAEAEAYPGPSLIIAYAPCINHGIKKGMSKAQTEEQLAVQTGYWHCFRFNPALAAEGKSAFTLDSKAPSGDYQEFLNGEVRYNSLKRANPAKAERLFGKNEQEAKDRYTYLNKLVKLYGAEEE